MGLPPWAHAAAGAAGGLAATAALHPLDTLRTRRQSLNAPPTPLRALLGAPRVLYRGMGPSLAGAGLSWGAYLSLYDRLRRVEGLPPGAAAAAAGAGVALLTTPVWVVKTRVQLGGGGRGGGGGAAAVARHVWATEGWGGLYRGLGASLLLVTHGVVQMGAYEAVKGWLRPEGVAAAAAAGGGGGGGCPSATASSPRR
ncbi:hypothetical protein BU14_0532s0004 [Porphyra umbilicalis]|uniref:Uncharacterized protein n=1 Tax=Porphyra umbilicalis TaxID=2786 RepID=A0A1X6NST6_PORUM|nr:hypothetical protein BU14_0532s0004 [Porphyra umbilicalis]|eukprot:OSX71443.1 hypothetical protein BU14_0532s0004 [Porphyra umbilicalis]